MTIQGLQELDEEQLHRLRELIRKERKSIVFTHIPEELWQYCENAINANKTDDSLLKAIEEWGIDKIFSNLNRLFQEACKVTGNDLSILVASLDFGPKDIERGRIDSFLAELRALFFLSKKKFTVIEPLKRKKKGKQCDFVGTRGPQKFAIEVFHTAERLGPDLYCDQVFVHDLCKRFRSKKCQVDATLNEQNCQFGLIINVLDRFRPDIKTSKSRFQENLRCVFNELKWGEQYYFAIATGNEINGILEDTVFPEFI